MEIVRIFAAKYDSNYNYDTTDSFHRGCFYA